MLAHFLILTFLLRVLGLAASPGPPRTAAGNQFGQWLDAFNTADEAVLLAYHDAAFPYDAAGPVMSSVKKELFFSKLTGGLEFKTALDSEEYSFKAILKETKRNVFFSALIRVDTSIPHQVVRLEFRRVPAPDEFSSPEEREARQVNHEQRQEIVESLAEKLEEHYIFKSVAAKMGLALRENLKSGQYDSLDDTADFCEALERDLRTVHLDRQMHVFFFFQPPLGEETSDEELLEHLRDTNFGFGAIKNLSHGIASVEINSFVPAHLAGVRDHIATLMASIANASALILDLRNNGGGDPATVSLVASYLFGEEMVHLNDMYDAKSDSRVEFWTDPLVPGAKFGPTKPVYVLINNWTASAGEELAYDLQALRRGTLIGETTVGAANPAMIIRLSDGILVAIPGMYPINPVTGTNWEEVGVVPDVKVPARKAFNEAYRRIKEELGSTESIGDETAEDDNVPAQIVLDELK